MNSEILFDEDGLIYKIENNGSKGYGDSLAETMRYYHLEFFKYQYSLGPRVDWLDLQTRFRKVASNFFTDLQRPETLLRAPAHLLPSPQEWNIESHEKDVPGDQFNPAIMALGAYGFEDWLQFLLGAQQSRGNRYQNGNFAVLTNNIWNRAFRKKPDWYSDVGVFGTILNVCEKVPFWDSGTKTLEFNDADEVADILNTIHYLMQCHIFGETWISKKSKAYLKKNCAKSYGSYPVDVVVNDVGEKGLGIEDKIMGSVAWYYRKDSIGLVEEYRPVIQKLFWDPA